MRPSILRRLGTRRDVAAAARRCGPALMAALFVFAILAARAAAQSELVTIGLSTDVAVDDDAQRALATPRLVLDIMPGPRSGLLAPRDLLPVGNYLLFTANPLESGAEPWRTDGTTAGTRLLRNIFPGPSSGIASAKARFGQGAVFGGRDRTTDCGLWYTDGTPNGTRRVYGSRDNCGVGPEFTPASVFFRDFTAVGEALYFGVTLQLWRSDGTSTGTGRVRAFDSSPRGLVALDERTLLFTAGTSDHGIELWRTDGTAEGSRWTSWFAVSALPWAPPTSNPASRSTATATARSASTN